MTDKCSKCGAEHRRRGQRYCLVCHAAYMRKYRKSHPLTDEQRKKDNARSYAGVYLRRGKIKREPCADCGSSKAEMHHPDYDKPLLIKWLCRVCHLNHHRRLNVEHERERLAV